MAITTTQSAQLYLAYFGRPADPAGQNFWTQEGSTNTMQQQSNNFATAPEWTNAISGMTNDQIVNLIYINSFGRSPEPAGLRFWSDAITNGILSVGDAAWQIVTNTGPADAAIVAAKVTAALGYTAAVSASTVDSVAYGNSAAFASANSWLDAITTSDEATAALQPAALNAALDAMVTASDNSQGGTYALTTGVDTITGTPYNDTFNASIDYSGANPLNTLQNFDSLNGNGGYDTLNAQLLNASDVSPVALTNIENFNLTAEAGFAVVNLVTATTAAQVTNLASSGDLTVNGIAAGAALSVNNVSTNTEFNYATTSGTEAASLTLDQVTNGARIGVTNIETLNIASNGLVGNKIDLVNEQTTLTVTGSADLVLDGVSNVTSIEAGTFTGDLTATLTQEATVVSGSGNDAIILSNGGSLSSGDGDDILRVATGGATIDAGEGDDIVYGGSLGEDVITLGDGNNEFYAAGALTNVTGGSDSDYFEFKDYLTANDTIDGGAGLVDNVLDVYVDTAETVSTTNITNIEDIYLRSDVTQELDRTVNLANIASSIDYVNNYASVNNGTIVVNSGETTIYQQVQNTGALTLKDAGDTATEVVNLNANGDKSTDIFNAQDITVIGVETLNINTGNQAGVQQNVGTITIDGEDTETAVTITASGDNAAFISKVGSQTTELLTIDFSELAAQELGLTADIRSVVTQGAVSIIGSEGTDNITGDANNSNTIVGAAGSDDISGGSAADSIDGGTGDDYITANGGNDTITGGDGDDYINVSLVGTIDVDGGAGDDFVNVANNLSKGDSIDGGSGINTFQQSSALIADFAGVTNFQVLDLDAAMTQNLARFTGNDTWEEIDAREGSNTVTNAATTVQTIALDDNVTEFTLSRISGETGDVVVHALQDETTIITNLTLNDEDVIAFDQGAITTTPASLIIDNLNAVTATEFNISGEQDTFITIGKSSASTGLGSTEREILVDATESVGTVSWDGSSAAAGISQIILGSSTAASTLAGGEGDDFIEVGDVAFNLVDAGNGDNFLFGGSFEDTLVSGNGDDIIDSGDGNDFIYAGDGDNLITVGDGNTQVVSGSGADDITVGNGTDSIYSGAGIDTITVGTGSVEITAGQDADDVELNLAGLSDLVNQGAADGVVASDSSLGFTVDSGNTLTFGDGLDVVSNFQATGAELDTLGLAVYGVDPINLFGLNPDRLAINENYYLSGDYNDLTGVFTVAANGVGGSDTIIIQGVGGVSLADNTSIVLLQGVDAADLSSDNFVDPNVMQAVYRSDNQYLVGGPAVASFTMAAGDGYIMGAGVVDYVGLYSQTNVEVIDTSFVNFDNAISSKGGTIYVDGDISNNLRSVVGTVEDDEIIEAVSNFGAANSTVDGGEGTGDILEFQSIGSNLTLEDISNITGAQITGIEKIELALQANATKTLTLGDSLTDALEVDHYGLSYVANIDLGKGAAHSYTTTVVGDTVTLGLSGQVATINQDGTLNIENAVAGSSIVTNGSSSNNLTLNNVSALVADYTAQNAGSAVTTVALQDGIGGSATTGSLLGIQTLDAGEAGTAVDITLGSKVNGLQTLQANLDGADVTFNSTFDQLVTISNIKDTGSIGTGVLAIKTTADTALYATYDLSTVQTTNVDSFDFSQTKGANLTIKATETQVLTASKGFIGTADSATNKLLFTTAVSESKALDSVGGFGTIELGEALSTNTLYLNNSIGQLGLNYKGAAGQTNTIVVVAPGVGTTGVLTEIDTLDFRTGTGVIDVTLESSTTGVSELLASTTGSGEVKVELSIAQLSAMTKIEDTGSGSFSLFSTKTAGGSVDFTGQIISGVDAIDFSASTSNVTVTTKAQTVFDANKGFIGSVSTTDTLTFSDDVAATTLDKVSGFETITLNGTNVNQITTTDTLVGNGQTLAIDATLTGKLLFDGQAETDGAFNIAGSVLGDNKITGGQGDDIFFGGKAIDVLNGGSGIDTLTGGISTPTFGNTFVFGGPNDVTQGKGDTITDFGLVSENILTTLSSAGNGFDLVGGSTLSEYTGIGGAFAVSDNVVVVTTVASALTSAAAATAIGSATGSYSVGDHVLFLVSNNTDAAVFYFTSVAADATVTAAELGAGSIINLTGVSDLSVLSASNFSLTAPV